MKNAIESEIEQMSAKVKLLIFFIYLIATFYGSNSSLKENWTLFVDPQGYFEVMLPDSVVADTTAIETQIGSIDFVRLRGIEHRDSFLNQYVLSFYDYPEGTFHADSSELVDLFFEGTIEEAVQLVEGELIYVNDYSDTFYPTRLWKIESAQLGLHFKSKAVVVGDRFYSLQVVVSETLGIDHGGDTFFDSFKVLAE